MTDERATRRHRVAEPHPQEAPGDAPREPGEPHRRRRDQVRRLDGVRLRAHRVVQPVDRLPGREVPVRAPHDDRVARGDLPLDVPADQRQPPGRATADASRSGVEARAAAGHREPGGAAAEPGADPALERDPSAHQGGPRADGGPRGLGIGRCRRVGFEAVPLTTRVRPRLAVDLSLTLGPLRRPHGDPCVRVDRSGAWWRATRTPDGPATVRIAVDGTDIEAAAWGDGAAWAVAAVPELLGSRDSLDGFEPGPGVVRELHRRMPGLRIGRSNAVFEALLPTVIAQKVIGVQAGASYRALVRAYGEPAPGPLPLLLPPAPAVLAATPTYAFHPLGLEARRAGVIREAARRANRLEEALDMNPTDATKRLRAIPGIGVWTAAEVAAVALGDPDAVS